jgi:ABC-type oligopeptide transport system ATPase subunit
MAGLVEIRDLTKRHLRRGLLHRPAAGPPAVDRVSFGIERGAVFGLVGESGCGKTTLARSLLHLDPPTSGEVLYDGVDIGCLPRRKLRQYRRRMQIVFQDPNAALDPKMRVRDSMAEGLRNLRVPRAERERRVRELLEVVGIPAEHASRWPHEFSGGQKQRIVIARALTMDPEFIVLDEPVSNLDVSIQAQIINLLMELRERFKLTYLFISHDLGLVAYLADRIGVMYRGRLVESAATEELLRRPVHPYTRRLFSSAPGATGEAAEEPVDEQVGELRDIGGGHLVAAVTVLDQESPGTRRVPAGNRYGGGER